MDTESWLKFLKKMGNGEITDAEALQWLGEHGPELIRQIQTVKQRQLLLAAKLDDLVHQLAEVEQQLRRVISMVSHLPPPAATEEELSG